MVVVQLLLQSVDVDIPNTENGARFLATVIIVDYCRLLLLPLDNYSPVSLCQLRQQVAVERRNDIPLS